MHGGLLLSRLKFGGGDAFDPVCTIGIGLAAHPLRDVVIGRCGLIGDRYVRLLWFIQNFVIRNFSGVNRRDIAHFRLL